MSALSAGTRLRRRVSRGVEWDASERERLALAVAVADSIEQLEKLLEEQGLTLKGSMGQIRLNPAVTELRLQRSALARILSDLRIPTEDPAAKDPRKQRAADIMHGNQRAARGAGRLKLVKP